MAAKHVLARMAVHHVLPCRFPRWAAKRGCRLLAATLRFQQPAWRSAYLMTGSLSFLGIIRHDKAIVLFESHAKGISKTEESFS